MENLTKQEMITINGGHPGWIFRLGRWFMREVVLDRAEKVVYQGKVDPGCSAC